jgi:hypothetical protein
MDHPFMEPTLLFPHSSSKAALNLEIFALGVGKKSIKRGIRALCAHTLRRRETHYFLRIVFADERERENERICWRGGKTRSKLACCCTFTLKARGADA